MKTFFHLSPMFYPIAILLLVSTLFFSCFGGGLYKTGSVLSYKRGVVLTQGGKFRVGELPAHWVQKDIDYRAVLFSNKRDLSSITIDAWCKSAADDSSLTKLSGILYHGIQNFKVTEQKTVTLHRRDALHTSGNGKVDGQEIFFSAYVLKMNACVFDFVYIGFPDHLDDYDDFHNMVQGFQYIKGPRIL